MTPVIPYQKLAPNARVTPETPMTCEEAVGKARDLILPLLGSTKRDALIGEAAGA